MDIQPTQAALPVLMQVKKAEAVVEASLQKMVRVSGPAAVEPASKKIVSSPPEINGENIALDFSVDPRTGERVVRILDKTTGELIREVPPEEVLQVMAALRALKGLLLSRKT